MIDNISDPKDSIDPARADAIHRAVLTGLLGNIGFRSDASEYTGARGIKFNIFPGSGVFKRKPAWIAAAELVETTRLYARTVAAIKPEWIERLAAHLVTRSYSEPHWQEASAHVVAFEKVTLYGLVLVPKRSVHYGPIDAVQSRQIFIHNALVEGLYKTSAPFFRHNQRIIAEVEALEAKARRRDVLVDSQVRHAFYDARVPPEIHNGPAFEKWRKEAERTNPQLLFMVKSDLMQHAADEVTQEQYPDAMDVGGMKLPLVYHLDPGQPEDGVTVTVPLAVLNQLRHERFEWLVPGLIQEKIEELIRTLPKHLRTNFIPVPDVARAVAMALRSGDGSLREALAMFLSKRSGLTIKADSFQAAALPDYLRMNFKVLDKDGKTLAAGRDLNQIRASLGQKAMETFADLPASDFNRDNITTWNFGDLPERVEVQRHGMTLQGHPAIVDRGGSVSLRLLDSPQSAREASSGGVRRLFILASQGELKYLAGSLPAIDRICLHYATLGKCDELKQDVMTVIAQRAFVEDQPLPRNAGEFDRRLQSAWPKMSAAATEIGMALEKTMAAYHALQLELVRPAISALAPAITDMRQQVANLVYKGFVARTPLAWLNHVPRFLAAVQARLAKLKNSGLAKDTAAAAQLQPLLQQYQARVQSNAKAGVKEPELELYRWMLEELRVSLFAQELKTSAPISVKRMETQWNKVKTSATK